MKATGIVRRIDDLGRVVIPKEIRRTLRIREGDPSTEAVFISVYSRGEIIINIDRLGVISVTPSLFFVVIHVIRCYTESKDFKKG